MKRNYVIIFNLNSMDKEGFYLLEKLGWAKENAIQPDGWIKVSVSAKDSMILEWLCDLTETPYETWY